MGGLRALVEFQGKIFEVIKPENIVIFRGDQALFEVDGDSCIKACTRGKDRPYILDGETESSSFKNGRMVHDSMPDCYEGDIESQAYLADRPNGKPKSNPAKRRELKRKRRVEMYGE